MAKSLRSLGHLGLAGPSLHKGSEEGLAQGAPSLWCQSRTLGPAPFRDEGTGGSRRASGFSPAPGCNCASPQGEPGQPGADGATGPRVSSLSSSLPDGIQGLVPAGTPVPQRPQRSSGAPGTRSLFFFFNVCLSDNFAFNLIIRSFWYKERPPWCSTVDMKMRILEFPSWLSGNEPN